MKIDVIVHGHKHRATWSHLRIGGTSVEPFFIEVLGAGSAMKAGDHYPRGHNFNVIDVAPAGARHVRQFFKHPDADRFTETAASAAEDGLSRLIRSRFRQPYRARRLTWTVQADEEGDARNELAFEAVVFNKGLDAYEILLPQDDSKAGNRLAVPDAACDAGVLRRSLRAARRRPQHADVRRLRAPAGRGGRARVLGRKLHAQLVRDEHPRSGRAGPGQSRSRLGRFCC